MPSLATIASITSWIVTGAVAGYFSSLVLKTKRQGCLLNVVLGIAGAFVGGIVVQGFLLPQGFTDWGFVNGICNATIGAVIILILIEIVIPGRQLGVRAEEKEKKKKSKKGGILADIIDMF